MTFTLDRFAASIAPQDADLLAAVGDYVAWHVARQAGEFEPSSNDDVEIRTYLLDLRIGGAGREAVRRKITALERFYAWARDEELIESSPFDEFNFDRPLLNRAQIRRRPDRLGADPRERETARLRALNRLADHLNQSTDLKPALDSTLQTVVESLGLQTAWAFLWTEAGLAPATESTPAPHDFALCAARSLPPGLERDSNYHLRQPPDCHCQYLLREGLLRRAVNIVECTRLQASAAAAGDNRGLLFHASVPLIFRGRSFGLINVATDEWQFLGAADLQLLSAAGAQVSITLERARLFARSVEVGALEERNRLAREIHDTLAQGLTAITLNLETADALLEAEADPARARRAVREALMLARANLEEARRSVLDLRAAPLEGRTLTEALASLAAQFNLAPSSPRIRFRAASDSRALPLRLEVGLYRIAQEALTNALRHAAARQVTIDLTTGAGEVRLTVEDDGRGFDPVRVPKDRYGLIGLNERAKLLGGSLRLESSQGQGTRVEVAVADV